MWKWFWFLLPVKIVYLSASRRISTRWRWSNDISVISHLWPLTPVSGCGDICAPITVCQSPDDWINDTTVPPSTSCPAGRQYCPYAEQCLPLASPCQSAACVNCSGVDPLPAGTQHPDYSLVGEVIFTLPPGPPTHVLVSQSQSK